MAGREKEPAPGSRGERAKLIKEAYDKKHGPTTVVDFAAALNVAAHNLGLPELWTGTRFSKIVHGQAPSLDDAACLLQVDPEHRTWDWLARGPQQRHAGAVTKRRAGGQ